MILRPYQNDIMTSLEGHMAFDDVAVIPLPGGGGKSAIIAESARLAHEANEDCVVLTNLSALIPQLSRHLDEFKVPYNVIKAGSHKYDSNAKVSLIMEQSFHKDKRKELNLTCDLLIKDEMHIGIGQKRYEDIVRSLNPSKTIGTTFTPIDEKGYLMSGITKDLIVETIGVKELVELGYLVGLKYFVPQWSEQVNYDDVGSSGSDYNGKEIERIVNTDEHNTMVINSMNAIDAKNKKTLVYASSIEHADDLKTHLERDGYTVGIVHSKKSSESNFEVIDRFNGVKIPIKTDLLDQEQKYLSELDCLVSVMGLTVGFDSPAAKLLVNLRPTKVLRLYLQMLARVSRPHETKEFGEILDLAQCTKVHGFLEDPIEYIEKDDKEALIKSKEKRSTNVVTLIAKEEPTEITQELILKKVEEVENKKKQIDKLSMKELIAIYNIEQNPLTIAHIAYDINRRKTGQSYTKASIEWVTGPWIEMLAEFPLYHSRLIKTMRTMFKNKVSQGKKLSALHYTAKTPDGWLRQQTPYCIDQNHHIDIDEDDIPF